MRRVLIAALISALGCGGGAHSLRRTLVTDDVPAGAERARVRAWLLDHDWCQARSWESTDEYRSCERSPYLNPSTRSMYSLFRYEGGRVASIAIFVPVPCRMYGRCDRLFPHPGVRRDQPFVDPRKGLVDDLVGEGRKATPTPDPVPSMQRRLIDGLAVELEARYGAPESKNEVATAIVWRTSSGEEIGLFLAPNGQWVVETHEFPPTR